jgi:hypothetical protein
MDSEVRRMKYGGWRTWNGRRGMENGAGASRLRLQSRMSLEFGK